MARGPSMLMPDQEVVLLEEGGPRVVDQRAVGLDGILDASCPGLRYFSAYSTERLKKSSPIRVGSPPCQAMVTSRRLVRLDELADVGLQHLVGHAEAAAGVEHLLGQEEAVRAVQVADRAGGLGQEVKGRRCIRG